MYYNLPRLNENNAYNVIIVQSFKQRTEKAHRLGLKP